MGSPNCKLQRCSVRLQYAIAPSVIELPVGCTGSPPWSAGHILLLGTLWMMSWVHTHSRPKMLSRRGGGVVLAGSDMVWWLHTWFYCTLPTPLHTQCIAMMFLLLKYNKYESVSLLAISSLLTLTHWPRWVFGIQDTFTCVVIFYNCTFLNGFLTPSVAFMLLGKECC